MCVLSVKVPIGKKSGNLFNDPRMKVTMIPVVVGVLVTIFKGLEKKLKKQKKNRNYSD